jgi:GT2 family glycosyltransferase
MLLDRRTIDSTGLMFDLATGLSHDRGSGEADNGQFANVETVTCCSFACVAIRREVVDTIGELDEKMVLYFEDIDYCVRATIAGWKVLYCPISLVFHARGGVTPKSSRRVGKRAVAYRLRIMLKCYSTRNVIRYGLARVVRDVISMGAGAKNKDFEYFLSYLRSPLWNLMNLPISERRLIQSTRKVSDAAISSPKRSITKLPVQ